MATCVTFVKFGPSCFVYNMCNTVPGKGPKKREKHRAPYAVACNMDLQGDGRAEKGDDVSNDPFTISDTEEWTEEGGWEEGGGEKKKADMRRSRLSSGERRVMVRRQYEEWEKRKKEEKRVDEKVV